MLSPCNPCFASMIWLGGVLRGLVWFADNDRGWVPTNEQPAATQEDELS